MIRQRVRRTSLLHVHSRAPECAMLVHQGSACLWTWPRPGHFRRTNYRTTVAPTRWCSRSRRGGVGHALAREGAHHWISLLPEDRASWRSWIRLRWGIDNAGGRVHELLANRRFAHW